MKFIIPILLVFALLIAWLCWEDGTQEESSLDASDKAQPIAFDATPVGYSKVAGQSQLWSRPLDRDAESGSSQTGPLFQIAEGSGIDFANDYTRKGKNLFMETGSGVAIGDYDNDGLNDVYLVGANVPNRLYKNLGGMKFEDVTAQAGVDGSVDGVDLVGSGATFADVDNDGFLDLFACNMHGQTLLYMNQGDGTFIEQAQRRGLYYFGGSKVGSFCDYDKDGDLDLYLLTYQDEMPDGKKKETPTEHFELVEGKVVMAGEQDILYRNNGDGTFEDISSAAGIFGFAPGLSAQWFDYDGDGWQDLYVTSDFHLKDKLYRNLGSGKFVDVIANVVKRTPWFSMGMDTGDLNGDGMTDFLVADMSGSSHFKQKIDMGEMQDANWFLSSGTPRQAMKNCLFINSGIGPFFEAAHISGLASTDWTWAVRFVDMDNDGKLDIFMSTGHARESMNSDFLEQLKSGKKGGIDAYEKIPVKKDQNRAYQNNSNNASEIDFADVSKSWGLDHVGVSHGAAFSDLDNDGDQDLIVNNYYENALVYQNHSDSNASIVFEFRCEQNNHFGIGTKVQLFQGSNSQVRTLTPTRGYISSDAPQLHFGVADSPVDRVLVTWPDGTQQEFTDLKPNHRYRIIEATNRKSISNQMANVAQPQFEDTSSAQGIVFRHKEKPFNDYLREPLLPYKISQLGGAVAWSDIDGDGTPDLFCGGAAGQAGAMFLNSGSGKFNRIEGPWDNHAIFEDMGVLFFDADGDGDQDLYIASGSNECDAGDKRLIDRLYMNEGDLKFSVAPLGTLPQAFKSSSCVAAVDFDRDGDLDLFVGSRSIPGKYPVTPESSLLENRDGKFVEVIDDVAKGLKKTGLINSAIWSDFNNDQWPDLILATDWGPPTFFENQKGKLVDRTEALGLSKTTGWWRGIERVDLDDDGDLDYIFTNQGTNTKYHADATHPHRLYYNDFDGNGTLDLVEAEFEGDTEFPVRGKSCSSQSMPFIGEKFQKFEDFALASLTDIYDESIRETDFREVNELRSCILYNDGDSFRIEAMDQIVQLSPSFSVLANDFDLDGQQDLFIANNFFASQPETGYMDGSMSLLLKGTGGGELEPVWPNQSGIKIHDASYSAAAADFDGDGDLDIAVGVNNGKVKLLENQIDPQDVVRIELPNTSFGSHLLLKGDGFQRRIEIGSNTGYLAQSWYGEILLSADIAKRVTSIEFRPPNAEPVEMPFKPESGRFSIAK
jgi:hypothetical protein